ncbi:RHS repeat-associated core domain-containing protein [Flavobacterium sp. NPDC079362]|uniref:RHS repeat-associated core domain-containing protein n=1 Tax=Flavobacterium sp. NPDC079362 TaxID=3390566 RepID=UPI003D093239
MTSNSYDQLGQLESKNVGDSGGNARQKVDFSYNIRGWLTGINDTDNLQPDSDPVDLFAFKINYSNPSGNSAVDALYNGNIAETFWKTASDYALRSYGYNYDNLNRLKNAIYRKPNDAIPVSGAYNESLSYDKNGNIKYLQRYGDSDAPSIVFKIDDLTYGYQDENSNQLVNVTEGLTGNDNAGFIDANKTGDDYAYDANGNMISDKNKNITKIEYNHLNLPKKIIFGTTGSIEYIYNAVGQKLEKIVTDNSVVNSTNYLGGFQYKDNVLEFFPTAEGYVKNESGALSYVFQYKDHLGNVRVSYAKNPQSQVLEIIEENNYYPFGLKHKGYNDYLPTANKYKYNGKELQDELGLNMYDYGWRNYMPDLGRWTQIDPLFNDLKFAHDINDVDEDDQEAVYMSIINDLEVGGGIYNTDNLNPYGYGYNNPVSFNDPDGRCVQCIWGAVIGAAVDYGLQVAVNYAEGKKGSDAWTDVSLASIAVSAGAGALSGGISLLNQYKNASRGIKLAVDVTTDTGVSVASQAIKDGKVSVANTLIDVGAGRLAAGVAGKIEKKALNSSTGKKLTAAVNTEKNIARGKSNVASKAKANVSGATKKLESYVGKRAAVSAAVSSGTASTAANKIKEKVEKK